MNLSRLRYHIKRFLRDTPLGDSIIAAVMKRGLRTGKSQGLSTPAELGRYLDQAIADLTADGGKQLTYFEAGVFAGDSLVVWSQRCDAAGVETSIYGADSFAGLPDSVAGDEGSWFPGSFYCPKAVTEWNLERKGLSKDRVRLIEGWFDQRGMRPHFFGLMARPVKSSMRAKAEASPGAPSHINLRMMAMSSAYARIKPCGPTVNFR